MRCLGRGEQNQSLATMATALHHLAWVLLDQGQQDDSRRLCGRALALYWQIGDRRGAADAWDQLGMILVSVNEPGALKDLHRSLRMRRAVGNRHGTDSSLEHLARANWRLGRPLSSVGYWA